MTRGRRHKNKRHFLPNYCIRELKYLLEKKSLLTWLHIINGLIRVLFQTIPYIKPCIVMCSIHTAECHVGPALVCTVQAFPTSRLACNNFRTTTQDVKQALMLHTDKHKWTVHGILATSFLRYYTKYTSMFECLTWATLDTQLLKTRIRYRIITSIINFMVVCGSRR